ncbi:isoliquiritigenin 2'-O-methyltransferase-like [Senna tora]|uniref:Isoliquiritigenin 2'-O-methyltransferase-like n=1 Tax=Senna tora TaxID=362788 RepID=A0A834TDB8_9FABA|nr:isoliquiritigenin 2'-O-methyltransferase-like [Senna tora]
MDSHHHQDIEEAKSSSVDDEAFLVASNVAMSLAVLAVLKAAIELKLFDIIARDPKMMMTPSQIASHVPLSQYPNLPRKLDRMLRLLANHSLLTCSLKSDDDEHGEVERIYGLSPAGRYFVHRDDGDTLANYVRMVNSRVIIDVCLNYKDAILDEGDNLFEKIHGKPMYHYLETDAELSKSFHTSMADLSYMEMKKILEGYEGFEGISTLVDVGGGNGMCLSMILSKYPSIKAINFDVPRVIQNAPSYPGIEHVGGDAIMLKYICHNWEDETCIQLLKNCYEVLPEKGKVIVIDLITAEAPDSSNGAKYISSMDNFMFFCPGGTLKEFESLCQSAGFSQFHLATTAFSVYGVMEFHK